MGTDVSRAVSEISYKFRYTWLCIGSGSGVRLLWPGLFWRLRFLGLAHQLRPARRIWFALQTV